MSKQPDPYSDDEAWDPDHAPDTSLQERAEQFESDAEYTTYYQLLDLEHGTTLDTEALNEQIDRKLCTATGDGNELRARNEAIHLIDAWIALVKHRQTYDRMLDELGPRLGHHTFVAWRIAGMPEDVDGWITTYRPENQSLSDL